MTADLTHLLPAYRPYALLSNEERIAWIRQDRWIGYPRAEQILVRLQDLLSHPPRDRMPCLLFVRRDWNGQDPNHSKVPARKPIQL